MRTAKFALTAAAVAAFGMASVSDAAAQACIGTPTLSGQRALALGASFPEHGTNYNARLDVNLSGPVSAYGAYTHTETVPGTPNIHTVGTGAAYQLPVQIDLGQVQLNTCPTARVEYAVANGNGLDQTHLMVPVGLGVGARVDVGQGVALTPYVLPEFYLNRWTQVQDGQRQAMDGTGLRATVGTALDFGPFFAGVDYITHYQADPRERQFDVPFLQSGTSSQLGLRVGVKF